MVTDVKNKFALNSLFLFISYLKKIKTYILQ